MSLVEKNDKILELDCDKNFSYVLTDNSIFSTTDYKVLNSQVNSVFVKCIKQLYNGKTNLYYVTDGFRSIESLYTSLSPETFLSIIGDLIDEILYIEENGFLSCGNINLAGNKIFINENDMSVRLIYLPIQNKLIEPEIEVEKKIRADIIKLIESYSASSNNKVIELSKNFADETETIKSLHRLFEEIKQEIKNAKIRKDITLRLVVQDEDIDFELKINSEDYIIGKNISVVDGAITFNRAISRIHCKVVRQNDEYYIMDLGSSNGTFVNETKVRPNGYHILKNNDIVRLADTHFLVKI